MAKKIVRSITGIKDINKQDLSTNNVGDLLSDGKDVYVHRKNGAKEEYFNLTSDKGDKYIADGDSGLEIWQKDGEDGKRIKLSQEFLKNNAQFISSEENSGLKATPRQDKYGKSYEIGFTDEAKAKIQDVVNKVNNIPQGGGKSKPIKVKPAPTPISAEEPVDVLTVKETDDSVTLGVTNNVLTSANFRGDTSTLGGDYISLEEVTWNDLDENFMDVTRHGWGLNLNENFWASRRNMKTIKGSGILLKEETDSAGLNLDTEDITFDIDSSKLIRHDCLLGDESKGIKVWHTDGESTSAISLTDDVWAKIQKIDSLSAGGGSGTNLSEEQTSNIAKVPTIETKVNELSPKVETLEGTLNGVQFEVTQLKANKANYVADGDTITFSEDLDGNKVIGVNSSLKKQINNAVNVEGRVKNLEKQMDSMVESGSEPVSITSGNGSVAITKAGNNFDLALNETTTKTLAKVTPLESKVTELENNAFAPEYNSALINGIRYTLVALPYGTAGNYLATITLETSPIASSSPVYLSRTQKFNKYLSNMSFPSAGYLQSGCILMKQNDGQIEIHTANDSGAGKVQGQFTVILSSL